MSLSSFVRQKNALIERRRRLVEEIRRIDEALRVSTTKEKRGNRRKDSIASNVEAFVRLHPGSTLRHVSLGTSIEKGLVSATLSTLTRSGRLKRVRDESQKVWVYNVGDR